MERQMYAKKRQSGRTDRENMCAEVCHKEAARETAPCRDCCLNIKDYEENMKMEMKEKCYGIWKVCPPGRNIGIISVHAGMEKD